MEWRHLSLTIVTITLIALPTWAKGDHCVQTTWNQVLIQQDQLDDWYNKHASSFNNLLYFHRKKIFLHQQFSETELKQIWLAEGTSMQAKLEQQIYNSTMVVSQLMEEESDLKAQRPEVEEMQNIWKSISTHCRQKEQMSNAIASAEYAISNQELEKDLNLLIRKISYLRSLYQQEVEMLEEVKESETN